MTNTESNVAHLFYQYTKRNNIQFNDTPYRLVILQ